jgi:hypothetical protein
VAEDDRAIDSFLLLKKKKRPLAVHDFLELPLLILFAAYISDPTID